VSAFLSETFDVNCIGVTAPINLVVAVVWNMGGGGSGGGGGGGRDIGGLDCFHVLLEPICLSDGRRVLEPLSDPK
jgi:hypothetical protein